MDAAALRSEFPVLSSLAYLNAGTDGPVPAAAADAARAALDDELARGRWTPHFEARQANNGRLRDAYARMLGADPADVALATGTSEGIGMVLAGMDLGPGDEIITSDQEHPGLLGPLRAARDRGAEVRVVALRDVADAVRPRTRLVACSHVSWVGGEVAPAALAELDVPVILDGAQGAGAVPLDMAALGCAAYAAAGQKWLCGADGTGVLYLEPGFRAGLRAIAPSYMSFAGSPAGLDTPLKDEAARHDTPALAREVVAFSLAAIETLESYGWAEVYARAATLAADLAERLEQRGRVVAPRAPTTLVSWEEADPLATRAALAEAGVIIRDLPGTSYLRASVGAWNDESDLERLLDVLR
ncbi:MAG TPA: aminotransferase class V-fold PLP-dependent enzyme [Solirubrobacteraceae bacterium]|jgi:L-cysteine/cystine lyase|nr:aminotransferase class V-fold PLP-dependent enzyme [Solirubrobacteraceae bacterium]